MKILGIDSSGNTASAALLAEDILIAEYTVNHAKTHSQTLLPMIEAMLAMTETDAAELGAVAIASGPGSFTGLRIGASNAKGLAGALGIPIIPVPTLEALAYHCFAWNGYVCPIMDARRNQVYTGIYEWKNAELLIHSEQEAVPIQEILEKAKKMDRKTIFLGDGVSVFKKIIEENLKDSCEFVPVQDNLQRAGSIAALGWKYYQKNKFLNAEDFVPVYLRLSQAERERFQ